MLSICVDLESADSDLDNNQRSKSLKFKIGGDGSDLGAKRTPLSTRSDNAFHSSQKKKGRSKKRFSVDGLNGVENVPMTPMTRMTKSMALNTPSTVSGQENVGIKVLPRAPPPPPPPPPPPLPMPSHAIGQSRPPQHFAYPYPGPILLPAGQQQFQQVSGGGESEE
jgi:hypothetical protein